MDELKNDYQMVKNIINIARSISQKGVFMFRISTQLTVLYRKVLHVHDLRSAVVNT